MAGRQQLPVRALRLPVGGHHRNHPIAGLAASYENLFCDAEVLNMVAELRAGAQSGAAEIGFDALQDATVRARVLKSLRLGYDFADLKEADQEQSKQVPMNLYCFTGQEPRSQEIEEFAAYTVEQNQRANE